MANLLSEELALLPENVLDIALISGLVHLYSAR
jgi:hypothetical protein